MRQVISQTPARVGWLLASVLLLGAALAPVFAQSASPVLEDRAYQLGAEAAARARGDAANAEALIAERYREVLGLSADSNVLARLKDAFQRGYREGTAPVPAPGRLTPPSADPQSGALGGEWSIMYTVWGTPAPRTLVLVQDGIRVTGRLTTAGGNVVRVNGSVSGDTVLLNFIYDEVAALAEFLPAEVARQVVGIRSQAEMRKGADGGYAGTLSPFSLAYSGTPAVVISRANGGSEDAKAKWSPSPTSMVRDVAPSPFVSARASASPSPAPPQSTPSSPGPRLLDVTLAHGVAAGRPVGPTDVFTPDENPLYVWFRPDSVPGGTTVTSDWFYEDMQQPMRIGEARATVEASAQSGQFNIEMPPGKPWPVGRYRVELRIADRLAAEARFRVAAGSAAISSAPGAMPGPRLYVHPTNGYQLVPPAGWTVNDQVATSDVQLRRDDGQAMVEITSGPVSVRLDPVSYAAGWESVSVGPGRKLRAKRAGRAFNLAGEMAYEGVYEGDGVYVKVLFTGVPDRFFVMTAVLAQDDFPGGEKVFDAMVQTFKPKR